jgi:hypothetical protein
MVEPQLPTPQVTWTIPFPDTFDQQRSKPITDDLILELEEAVKGEVITRDNPKRAIQPVMLGHVADRCCRYSQCTYTFNRGLRSPSQLVVRPLDAQDVSAYVFLS